MSGKARWTNAKVALVAFMLGQGVSASSIARRLADGTQPAIIRQMRRYWQLPAGSRGLLNVAVPMDARTVRALEKRAAAVGIPATEFLRRISTCVVNDDLYNAVTDGRY